MSNSCDNWTVRSQIWARFQLAEVACLLTLAASASVHAQVGDNAALVAEQAPDAQAAGAAGEPESAAAVAPQGPRTDSANVRISTDPRGAHVLMDGALIGVAPLTVRLPVGSHRLRVMSAGYHSQELDFRVTDAQPTTKLFVALQIDRPRPADSDDSLAAYSAHPQGDPKQAMLRHLGTAGIATGVLALGGALVLEIMRSQAAENAREEAEQIRFAEAVDRTHSRQTWARILAGTGGVLTVLGVTLLVVSRGTSRGSESHVALTCAPGACSAQLRGAF
jgi:hypothetical protein